jgi:hypothetical protein
MRSPAKTTKLSRRDFVYPLFREVAKRQADSGEGAAHSAKERSDFAERFGISDVFADFISDTFILTNSLNI